MGTVAAGTCGAIRTQAIGVAEDREVIVIEHVTRLAHDVAPHWATGVGDLSYRTVITGTPTSTAPWRQRCGTRVEPESRE